MKLSDYRTRRVPTELKQRVLRAAGDAREIVPAPTIWDRLWESRALRAAWVLAVAALLVGHVAVGRPGPNRIARDDNGRAGELRELIALPSMEISPRAEALMLGTRRRARSHGASKEHEVES